MLHGSGPGTTGSGAWASTAQALGTSWRLVAPDQAGFGRTPIPASSRGGLRLWTEQAAGLMDALGVEHYAVVGHSMGGAVALALASARPQQVTRVVAVSTMGAPGAPLSAELDAVWAAPAGPLGARDMLSRLVLDQALVTESAVAARAAAMRAGAAAFASLFPPPRARWADDLALSAQTLAGIRAPVLLVHGAEDRVTPLGTAALPCSNTWPMSVCTCSADAGTCRRSNTRTTSGNSCRASSACHHPQRHDHYPVRRRCPGRPDPADRRPSPSGRCAPPRG
ncbi:alpha/beta fold hydrolase [Nonomuraea thailandensis]